MTSIITNYFQDAQLSLAAYAAALTMGVTRAEYIAALKDSGMAQESPANAYGFSATLFERAGQKYLAIRGSDDLIDYFVDLGIFMGTGAVDQYRALEDYYQDLF
jgi:hypothetical protein